MIKNKLVENRDKNILTDLNETLWDLLSEDNPGVYRITVCRLVKLPPVIGNAGWSDISWECEGGTDTLLSPPALCSAGALQISLSEEGGAAAYFVNAVPRLVRSIHSSSALQMTSPTWVQSPPRAPCSSFPRTAVPATSTVLPDNGCEAQTFEISSTVHVNEQNNPFTYLKYYILSQADTQHK